MSMIWRDPFEVSLPLREAMNRLFEESVLQPGRAEMLTMRSLPVDIYESDDKQQYIIEANLAGFKPEEIQVTASGDTMMIHAAKKEETKIEKSGYMRRERFIGEVNRAITLPSNIDAEKVQATFEQGVLTMRVPKAPEGQPKQIPVKTVVGPQ